MADQEMRALVRALATTPLMTKRAADDDDEKSTQSVDDNGDPNGITGYELAKYLGGYGLGGAALGALSGALVGDLNPLAVGKGMMIGGAGGAALGALAAAARRDRWKDDRDERSASYDTPNWTGDQLANHKMRYLVAAGLGGLGVHAPSHYGGLNPKKWSWKKPIWSGPKSNTFVSRAARTGTGAGVATALTMLTSYLVNLWDAHEARDIPDE